MRGMLAKRFAALAGFVVLTACSGGDPELMNISTTAPDEFSILPTKPLEAPEDYTTLPEPTPGGKNLVDPAPQAAPSPCLSGCQE